MAQLIEANLPVRCDFLRYPAKWEILDENGEKFVRPSFVSEGRNEPERFDPWELRNEFLRLTRTQSEEQSILNFLNHIGLWQWRPGFETEYRPLVASGGRGLIEPALPLEKLFDFQDALKRVMRDRNLLYGGNESTRRARVWILTQKNCRYMGQLIDHVGWMTLARPVRQFSIEVINEKSRPCLLVTTHNFWDGVMLSVHVDYLRGAKFRKCQRRDCPITFARRSKHKRQYCSWYCGHIESVRRGRRYAKKR